MTLFIQAIIKYIFYPLILAVAIGFDQISYMVDEDSGTATIRIIKKGDADSDITVTFSTVDGSAGGKRFK